MKMTDFDLVIGGSGEIGIEIIKKLTGKNRNVLYTYHKNAAVVNEIEAQLHSKSGQAIAIELDVQLPHHIERLANYISSEKIKISSLIYNAGKTNDRLFHTMTEEDFTDVLDVNLYGCFRVCKTLINNIAANRGCIVFISSISGLVGKLGQVNYSCSKAGLIALGRNLATEYAGLGVRVNCIAPGLIKTKMLDKMNEQHLKSIKKEIPLKRIGLPEDVAAATLFLISEESCYITGQTLIVDGGLIMR